VAEGWNYLFGFPADYDEFLACVGCVFKDIKGLDSFGIHRA